MSKVVGIVGYKNSGKTTLARALAQELARRGHRVAVVKHTSHPLALPGKDTTLLVGVVEQVGVISPQESAVYWNHPLSLEQMMAYLDADIVLVEGFKAEETYPKVACLRGKPDDADLFDGLVIAAVGPAGPIGEVGVPLLGRDDVGGVADLVERGAFKLPGLDCEACGRPTCYEMAREIVAGSADIEDCVSLRPAVEVRIDGQVLPMNPFIARIVRETVLGLLSSLKGFRRGGIEMRL